MKFTKITFERAMFIDGFCSGASSLTDADADILDEGLGFSVGDEMTIVPWTHVLTAKFQRPRTEAAAQPPPPPKNKRR